jgi:dTDP-4-amino-4,6-dideoxygalactose transaminase
MSVNVAAKGPKTETAEPVKMAFDFLDLKAQYAGIREEVMAAVTRVMDSQYFILGPEVKKLEEELAAKLCVKHAIGCASGTDALILVLLVAGIGSGDEVITSPFSFVASPGSIAYVGAKPVFVDIDPATFNIDPALIEAAITPKTRAIMPVHLFGLPADMDPILAIAKKRGLLVIEAASAFFHRRTWEERGTVALSPRMTPPWRNVCRCFGCTAANSAIATSCWVPIVGWMRFRLRCCE